VRRAWRGERSSSGGERCYYYYDDHESWQKTRLCRK